MSDPKKLLTGWSKSRIGDVVEDRIKQGLPEDAREFTYVDISAVDNQLKEIVAPRTIPIAGAPSRARQRIQCGDVLVSTTRPNLNAVALVSRDLDGAVASTGFAVLRPVLLNSHWLFSVVQSEDFTSEMSGLVKGALYPAVRPGDVHDYVMPVPPLAEQNRITVKLARLLKRSRNIWGVMQLLPALIHQYRAAVLQAACAGRLVPSEGQLARKKRGAFEPASILLERSLRARRAKWEANRLDKIRAGGKKPKDEKWRAKYKEPLKPQIDSLPHLPIHWCWAGTEELTAGVDNAITIGPFGSNLKVKDYRETGVPLVFVREIRSENFSRPDTRYVSEPKAEELASHKVRGGDVLITKMGEPPGDTAIYPIGFPDAIATADCMNLTPNLTATSPDFLKYAIRSSLVRDQIAGISRGVAQQKMSLARFKTVAIPLPPLAEQKRIVAELERRLSALTHVEECVEAASEQTARLRLSLLYYALSGRLVRQDHRDEPATRLLARIRAIKEELARLPRIWKVPHHGIKKEDLPMLTPEDIKPNHLANILRQQKRALDAKVLWKESQLSIDDFYAQLKKELGKTLIETGRDRRLRSKS
jgi:type I restriction enzyme S subunit